MFVDSSAQKIISLKSRRCLWLFLMACIFLYQGPGFVRSLYPSRTSTYDFYQDWNSARNFHNGLPIYADIGLTIERYLGWPLPEDWPPGNWRVNAHPPPCVFLVLPFAWLDYPDAFLVWALISLAALGVSLWLIIRQLDIRFSRWSVLSTVTFLLLCYPFRDQVTQGQISLVLLLLVTLVWVAGRSGHSHWAGVALGVATAVKLFPGFLFLYFVLRRQWKVVASGAVALAVVMGVSALTFGLETFYTYIAEVLPTLRHWQSHSFNISVIGFWSKLFDPLWPGATIIPLWRSPMLAQIGGLLSCAVFVSTVAWTVLQARTQSDYDQAFGLMLTAMLFVTPLTWDHYLLLLALPLAITWVRSSPSGSARWLLILMVVTLSVPAPLVWKVLLPGKWPHGTANSLQTLTVLSFQFYALLGVYALQFACAQRLSLLDVANPSTRKTVEPVQL